MQPTGRIEPELRSGTDRRWRSVERRIVWARSLKLAADAHFVRQQPTKGVRSSALEHDLIPPWVSSVRVHLYAVARADGAPGYA